MRNLTIVESKDEVKRTGTFAFNENQLKNLYAAVMRCCEAEHSGEQLTLSTSEYGAFNMIMKEIEDSGLVEIKATNTYNVYGD
jgi:hypothetical protein